MSRLLATDAFDLLLPAAVVIMIGVVLLVSGKRLLETLLALNSEILTLLILLALAVLAGVILKTDSKEILSNLVSGLLGYLTKSGLTAYQARMAAPQGPASTKEIE